MMTFGASNRDGRVVYMALKTLSGVEEIVLWSRKSKTYEILIRLAGLILGLSSLAAYPSSCISI